MLYTTRGWRPVDLGQLQREMNRLFERYPNGVPTPARNGQPEAQPQQDYPPVCVWRSGEGVCFTVELPGYEPDDVQISTVGNTLTIRGHRHPTELKPGDRLIRNERHTGDFVRTFELPFEVDPESTSAVFIRGVLQITLGRPEEHKPHVIKIKAG